jgi:hypothetical protein
MVAAGRAQLAPVDRDLAAYDADGDRQRAEKFIRRRLAEGRLSPSSRHLLQEALRTLQLEAKTRG